MHTVQNRKEKLKQAKKYNQFYFAPCLHAFCTGGDYVSMKGLEGTSSRCSSFPGRKTFEDEHKGLEIIHKCGWVAMANAGLW